MSRSNAQALASRSWARRLVESNRGVPPLDLVGTVVSLAARSLDSAPVAGTAPAGFGDDFEEPPDGWADPWLPGLVHEQAVTAEDRSSRGAWYTPQSVVRGLVALATADGDPVPTFAADPTCGGGAFLLAMLDRYRALGYGTREALNAVAGMDIDPGAVQVSRWSIVLWAARNGVEIDESEPNVIVGNALENHPDHWPGVRVLMGNPPFATPLRTGAVPADVSAFRAGREHLLGAYTDLAAMHLLAAVESSQPGSSVVLIQPQSILSGRDTTALRDHCDRVAPVYGMWASREPLFDAGVRACAAVLRPGASTPGRVRLAAGPDVTPVRPQRVDRGDRTWSGYAARALGAPDLPPRMAVSGPAVEQLGSLVSATAGFRDEYYGLLDACREWQGEPGGEPNRLLTVGSVEPLATRWGIEHCRFGGKRWFRPWIDTEALEPKVRNWTERQLQPKVVVATQSRLLEPVIDRSGCLVPATPLLAVHAPVDDLDLVAAVLLAPPVVAWAWRRWFGSAMAVDALKLAARQVLELPLPEDRSAWRRAAGLITTSELGSLDAGWEVSCAVATIMNRAYRADPSVLAWWLARAKSRTAGTTAAGR